MPDQVLMRRGAVLLVATCLATGCGDGRAAQLTACLSPATLDHDQGSTKGQTSLALRRADGIGRVWLHELALKGADASVRLATSVDPVFPVDTETHVWTQPFGFVIEPRVTMDQGLTLDAVLYAEKNDESEQFADGFMQLQAQNEPCPPF